MYYQIACDEHTYHEETELVVNKLKVAYRRPKMFERFECNNIVVIFPTCFKI